MNISQLKKTVNSELTALYKIVPTKTYNTYFQQYLKGSREGSKSQLNKLRAKILNHTPEINTQEKLKQHIKILKIEKQNLKDELDKQTKEILNITGYDNPTTKLTREERIKKSLDYLHKNVGKKDVKEFSTREKRHILALKGAFQEIVIENEDFARSDENGNLFLEIDNMNNMIVKELLLILYNHNGKVNLLTNLIVEYRMKRTIIFEGSPKVIYGTFYYNSKFAEKLQSKNQIEEWVKEQIDLLNNTIADLEKGSSGWSLFLVDSITIQIQKSNKTKAGSYIETPKNLMSKKAVVNIQNKDDRCILYAISASKYYDTINSNSKNKPYHYNKYLNEIIEPENIKYPIDIQTDIKKFEKLNKIKINVFYYDPKDVKFENILTLYNTKERNNNVVNLLLLSDKNKDHIVWIKDLSKLMRMNSNHHKVYSCSQCLCKSFNSQEQLDKHLILCFENEAVSTKLPHNGYMKTDDKGNDKFIEPNNKLYFKNENHKFKHPFSCYVDFECTLENLEVNEEDNTQKYQQHRVNSVAIKYNCIHNEFDEYITKFSSSNENEVLEFTVNTLERLSKKSYDLSKRCEKIYHLTPDEDKYHKLCVQCDECKCNFTKTNRKIIHHDHINGKYISSICNDCNLKFQYKKFMPVYYHNLKGYDSHFIVRALNTYGYKSEKENITCIPNNEERYISFSKSIKVDEYQVKKVEEVENKDIMYEIRFLDTLAFMPSSLCGLGENLQDKCKGKSIDEYRKVFKYVSQQYPDDKEFFLMIQKGIYPYEYINNFDRLYDNELPDISKFYSKLNNEECDIKDYERAQLVWKTFNCKTLLDYHNLYLISDVLLLADIFENFKDVCYKIYGLDASYYYTAPSLSWDSFLKHKNEESLKKDNKRFEIELITDIDMYNFIENGIRGGLSQISKRYAKANNKYMSNYNPKLKDEYILYLDANNLYGYAMCEYLPQNNFKWNDDEWTKEKILKLGDEDDIGYLFSVNLKYPEELHDLHNGYALASENKKITKEMLNEWQQENYKNSNVKKLITSFDDKNDYVINYRLLKLFLQLGLELVKVNKVLQYHQDNYMKSYIMKNTLERSKASNEFEKDFYKLMNNSVYGKTMENVRNRINFRLISSEESALRIRNNRKRFTIFNNDLVGVHLCKQEVNLNKPIFIGQNVLDQSKFLMYDFHYNFMLKKFDRRDIDLLFTDTDSLCYHIKNKDPFEVMKDNKDLFDLSNYNKTDELYDATNKKVIGKFKNESTEQIIEFVGLRSKLYSYKTETEESKKCKGVKRSVVENDILFEHYKNILFNRQTMNIKQNGFRSVAHKVFTETTNKIALSGNDDKCYITNNNIMCFTHSHYRIKK